MKKNTRFWSLDLPRETCLNQIMNPQSLLRIASCLLLLTIGCQKSDDQIQTYRVSKETGGGTPMPMASAPPAGSNPGPMSGGTSGAPMMGGGGGGAAPAGSEMESLGAGMGVAG